MKRKLLLLAVFLFSLVAFSQNKEAPNVTDASGRKQGHWIKLYPDSTIMYEGYFKNDKPVGDFRRYSEDGKIKSLMRYKEGSNEVKVTFYHPNGFIAAEGVYINQLKEGKWSLYSEKTENYLICEEIYKNDLRNGPSLKYYQDGKKAESVTYINDTKQGEWIQFYVTGNICIRGNYKEGKLQGPFSVLFANGKPEYIGQYNNDVRDGKWKVFNEDGTLKHEMTYKMGAMNDPELRRKENEFLDRLERNKGTIADPEITGTIWK